MLEKARHGAAAVRAAWPQAELQLDGWRRWTVLAALVVEFVCLGALAAHGFGARLGAVAPSLLAIGSGLAAVVIVALELGSRPSQERS